MHQFHSVSRRMSALAATGAIGLTLTLALAGTAEARLKGTGTATGCPVVDSDTGRVLYHVAPGTRSGLFYCGADGEWHFGTVVLDWRTSAASRP